MTELLAVLMISLAQPADLQTVARGTLSGIERPREVVVRIDSEWRALWADHARHEARPHVDFASRTVLAVFLGSRNTAGFGVDITGVERTAEGATVRYRESRPGPDQMLAQIVTTPFHIVQVPRIDGTVRFVKQHDD